MITNRLLFTGIVLASLASACTAIVLGKIGDANDYPVADGGSGTSSGSNDPCSLLADRYGDQADANACSDCINTSCKDPTSYFCSNATPASYFSTLQNCAQSPWNGRSPPSSGASFYGCDTFAKTIEVPNDPSSEAAHEAVAHNCVTNSCLQGGAPPCRLCEVSTKKPGSGSEYALLRDDACGSCLVTNCAAELSQCCSTAPMNDFVEKCAYTALSSNKATCLELGKASPDAGANNGEYDDAGTQCLKALSACFKTSCDTLCQSVTTGG